jgi:HEAT repeat protein
MMRRAFAALVSAALFVAVVPSMCGVSGCRIPEPSVQRTKGVEAALEDPPLPIKIRDAVLRVRTGTEDEAEAAETKLKQEFGHASIPWLAVALEEKQSKEVEKRLTNILVSIFLKDASSVRKEHRTEAVNGLVGLDKKHPIIDQLLLRLESADQKLSDSIFEVLEKREYISGEWAWPDQAWEELSVRFGENADVIKRYIVYRLTDLPKFDSMTMNWEDYDRRHAFSILSKIVIGEDYRDVSPLYVKMLDAYAPRVREQAASVLGHMRYLAGAEKLTKVVAEDPSDNVRAAAAEALGRMKAEEVGATTLILLLRSGELLGSKICWALGEMKSQKAVGALIQADEQPAALIALGKIGNEVALKPLIRILETSKDTKVRAAAARALGDFNSDEALNALKKAHLAETSSLPKIELLFAMFRIAPEAHRAAIEPLKRVWDVDVRVRAMVALTSRGYLEDIGKVMELMEGLTPDRRNELWKALAQSFDGIPDYHAYGLTHRRLADTAAIVKWFTENRSRLYWDKESGKYGLR